VGNEQFPIIESDRFQRVRVIIEEAFPLLPGFIVQHRANINSVNLAVINIYTRKF